MGLRLLDHLVGERKNLRRDFEPERLGGPQVITSLQRGRNRSGSMKYGTIASCLMHEASSSKQAEPMSVAARCGSV
jgi:hypothetical protein